MGRKAEKAEVGRAPVGRWFWPLIVLGLLAPCWCPLVGMLIGKSMAADMQEQTEAEICAVTSMWMGVVGGFAIGGVGLVRLLRQRGALNGSESYRYYAALAALREEKHKWEVEPLSPEDAKEYATMRGSGFSHDEALYSLRQRGRGRPALEPSQVPRDKLAPKAEEVYRESRALGLPHDEALARIEKELGWRWTPHEVDS